MFTFTISSIAHTVYSQDMNESCTGRSEESQASYSRDEQQYLELYQEKENIFQEHPIASERNGNTKRLIKKIQNKMRKIGTRLSTDAVNLLKPKAAKSDKERKQEQRMRMSDLENNPEKEKKEPMSQDERANFSVDFSQVSELPASNPKNSKFATSTPLKSSTQSKRVRFDTSQQDSACTSFSEEPFQSQSSEAPSEPSQDRSQQSSSQVEEDYLKLLQANEAFLEEHPVANQRSKEEKAQIQKIRNKMKKTSKRMDISQSREIEMDRKQARQARQIEMERKQTRVSGCRERRAKEREGQDDTLGLRMDEKNMGNDMRTCPHCHESKHKKSLPRHIRLMHNNPTSLIIQSMKPMETIHEEQPVPIDTVPEEQPVLENQLVVEEQHAVQQVDGREESLDLRKVIKCKQGTRKGQKCTDILWVGNVDEEGRFKLCRKIKDYFFKYIGDGYQTIMVRTTVEVPIHMVAEWVCEFFDKKVGMPQPWQTCIAKELTLNFKGEAQTGQDLLSTYPQKSLFLLSKGPLPEQFKNHQGKLWQCTGKCGKAQDLRFNIKDKKCTHKFLFDRDQPSAMGDNLKRDKHIPVFSCGTLYL